MKKYLLFICASIVFACSGVKKTQRSINTGNYSVAIETALANLADNKTKKSNQPFIVLLEEVFQKNTSRELQHIDFLKKEGNGANYEIIFKSYANLKQIQERIKPLLPLQIYEENRPAKFRFQNYDTEILAVKEKLSDYLYTNALGLLNSASSKVDYRKAYDDFAYLEEINPGYGDSKKKKEEAYLKGLDFVKVVMTNETDQIIPEKLEADLLNFNTYGLNNFWTEYHTNPLPNIAYDYTMEVALKGIAISPEKVSEKQVIKEKQIKDGYQYATDSNGNILSDSLGNKIKIDKFKTIKCNFYQFTQFKSTQVSGEVSFTDLAKRQVINSYPLSSEFVFEHSYASYDGDKRALENDMVRLLNLAAVPFPSNEQMVYDTGEDLKLKLKTILTRQQF